MTDDDLTRLRDEVAGVTWRHKIVRPDGDPVTWCVCLTWSKGRGSITADDRAHNEHLADALLPLLTRKIAEARCPLTEHDGTHGPLIRQAKSEALRGARFRVEVACDGYEALTEADVPDEMWSPSSYIAGAAEAARKIRAALAEPTGPEGER